jgi:hypothetical protein
MRELSCCAHLRRTRALETGPVWTTTRSVVLLAVAVPAMAYGVLESVVDESTTASRPVVVLDEVGGTQSASGSDRLADRPGRKDRDAGEGRPSSRPSGPSRTGDDTSCDDDPDDDPDGDPDDDRDDEVSVVRPCPADVREDDPDDRDDDVGED